MHSNKKVILAVQNNQKMEMREIFERATGIEIKKNRRERRLEEQRKKRK